MREIKFRGWHTSDKVMFSAETMAADQLTLLTTGSFINVHNASTRLSIIYPRDAFIPLQFTGLKDKKGKEIYEGDVIRRTYMGSQPGGKRRKIVMDVPVVYRTPRYMYEVTPGIFAEIWEYEDMEIIGNIYENPELLK